MIEPHTETAQIFQFADARQKFGKKPASQPATDRPRTAAGYFLKEDVSETCKNARLRSLRHDNWRKANTLREYWSASVKMMDAIERVQHHNMLEGNLHPEHKQADRWALIAKWRVAIVRQLLTPAPTAAEITWKRAAFKAGDHHYTDVKPGQIERAIADDVEFLKAHPTRRPRGQEQ